LRAAIPAATQHDVALKGGGAVRLRGSQIHWQSTNVQAPDPHGPAERSPATKKPGYLLCFFNQAVGDHHKDQ